MHTRSGVKHITLVSPCERLEWLIDVPFFDGASLLFSCIPNRLLLMSLTLYGKNSQMRLFQAMM